MVTIKNIQIGDFPVLLAPLEDITDLPFRIICKEFGAEVVYTEFISSEGLIRDAWKSTKKLVVKEEERPVGIQIFGHDMHSMVKAAKIAEKANPDLIDLNYGCPVKKVAKKGAGAAMLAYLPKMESITRAVVKATKLPVTAKTRLGIDENSKNIVEAAERLQDAGIAALTIHARTKAQLYSGIADWSLIGEVMNNPRMKIPIIGNGDIKTPQDAEEKKNRYGVHGIMIGRGAIGNPWIFNEVKHYLATGNFLPPPTIEERVAVCKRHIQSSIEWKGEKRTLFEMRKHYGHYFKAIPNFKPYRVKLVTTTNFDELFSTLDQIKNNFPS